MKFRSPLMAVLVAALVMPLAVVAADTSKATKAPASEKAGPKKADTAVCEKVTGTRIKLAKNTDCEKASNRPIRSYSAEELRNTGEIDLARALRTLDPSIQ